MTEGNPKPPSALRKQKRVEGENGTLDNSLHMYTSGILSIACEIKICLVFFFFFFSNCTKYHIFVGKKRVKLYRWAKRGRNCSLSLTKREPLQSSELCVLTDVCVNISVLVKTRRKGAKTKNKQISLFKKRKKMCCVIWAALGLCCCEGLSLVVEGAGAIL